MAAQLWHCVRCGAVGMLRRCSYNEEVAKAREAHIKNYPRCSGIPVRLESVASGGTGILIAGRTHKEDEERWQRDQQARMQLGAQEPSYPQPAEHAPHRNWDADSREIINRLRERSAALMTHATQVDEETAAPLSARAAALADVATEISEVVMKAR